MGGQVWINDEDENRIKSIIDHFFFRWVQVKYNPGAIIDEMQKEEAEYNNDLYRESKP